MASLDNDIDALYRLPLGEFAAARDALAKRAGDRKGEIKNLQKPNAAAWAINQLYWQRRKSYDRLVSAAQRLRSAHAQQLAGKKADVASAESLHQAAVRAAAAEVRAIVDRSGDPASPATMTAVVETLRALPAAEAAGRFARPLKPQGFEALAHLLVKPASGKKAPVLSFAKPQPAAAAVTDRASERRAQAAARREAGAIERQLRAIWRDERAAKETVARVRRSLAQAEAKQAALERAVEEHRPQLRTLRDELVARERAASQAATERDRLELALRSAKSRS